MKYGKRLVMMEGTGFDRIREWGLGSERWTQEQTEGLEEKWAALSSGTSRKQVLYTKILDLRFGITGKPHTVESTAKLLNTPKGTMGGKIFEAAYALLHTDPSAPKPKPKPRTKPQPVPVAELPDDGVPVTFERVFSRRKSPLAGWLDLPTMDRQWLLLKLLEMREEREQTGQMAKRHGLPEIAAECWDQADTLRVAMRVLESGE